MHMRMRQDTLLQNLAIRVDQFPKVRVVDPACIYVLKCDRTSQAFAALLNLHIHDRDITGSGCGSDRAAQVTAPAQVNLLVKRGTYASSSSVT